MTRLNKVDPKSAEQPAAGLLQTVESKFGFAPNLTRVMANQPSALKAYLDIGATLTNGNFDPKTRSAVALTVAGANECEYCAKAHGAVSASLKVDASEIERQLNGESSDPKLNALLVFTAAIIEKRGRVDDAELSAVRASGYTDGDIVELVANITENIFTNYMNHVADTDVDFPSVLPKKAA